MWPGFIPWCTPKCDTQHSHPSFLSPQPFSKCSLHSGTLTLTSQPPVAPRPPHSVAWASSTVPSPTRPSAASGSGIQQTVSCPLVNLTVYHVCSFPALAWFPGHVLCDSSWWLSGHIFLRSPFYRLLQLLLLLPCPSSPLPPAVGSPALPCPCEELSSDLSSAPRSLLCSAPSFRGSLLTQALHTHHVQTIHDSFLQKPFFLAFWISLIGSIFHSFKLETFTVKLTLPFTFSSPMGPPKSSE